MSTQFKIGDKVKYNQANRECASTNSHDKDKIYTIRVIYAGLVKFEESKYPCRLERLEHANPTNRHPHADLMIAYANDMSLEIQYKLKSYGVWYSTKTPCFDPNNEYRIKPKSTTKYQVLYMDFDTNQATVSKRWYESEEEFNKIWTGIRYKFISLIKETAKEF